MLLSSLKGEARLKGYPGGLGVEEGKSSGGTWVGGNLFETKWGHHQHPPLPPH